MEIADELIKWTQDNKKVINCNKTKEMILGKAKPENIPHLEIGWTVNRTVYNSQTA